MQMVGEDARHANAKLRCDMPTQELTINADEQKLEQVIVNLLNNAIESLAEGGAGGTVTCRARRQPRQAMFEIEDDGPGIKTPGAPIFDAFFTTKPNGTGLGLAVVHRIIADHAGTIDVESRAGRTCFRVLLPLEPENLPESKV
jgi:signal transduction histidine kinase